MNVHPIFTPASPSPASPLFDASFDSIESLTTTFATSVVPTLETTTVTEVALGYHRNQQYSITAMTTSTGAVAERYAYTAYGQPTILNASGTVLTSSAVGNRYTYTGREWDETLGLHHFRARWMSPLARRCLGRDPIGYIDGPFLYVWFRNVHGLDPLGLSQQVGRISNCSSEETNFSFNITDDANRAEADGAMRKFGGKIGPFLGNAGKMFQSLKSTFKMPEFDVAIEFASKTKYCDEQCKCGISAQVVESEYKVSGQLKASWNRIRVPGVLPPGTRLNRSVNFHLNTSIESKIGGCANHNDKHGCFKAGVEAEIELCGGVPDVLQGCIKFSVDCNVGYCLAVANSPQKSGNGCDWEITGKGCVGWLCREYGLFQGSLF